MAFALTKTIRKLLQRDETRQAGMLVTAQIASQLLLLATLPLLARLYQPSSFGEHAAFLGLATLVGSVMTLGYLTAIYLARGAHALAAVYRLCVVVATVMMLAFAIMLVGLDAAALWTPFKTRPLLSALLLAASAGLLAYQVCAEAMHARAGSYRAVAWAKFNITLFPGISQILLAFTPLQAIGLNLGRVIGQVALTILTQAKLAKPRGRLSWSRRDRLAMTVVARRFSNGILEVPRILLARGGTTLLPLVITAGYGATAAGLFFFADRVVARPAQLLNDALSRIPLRNYAERIREGKPLVKLALGYSAMAFVVGLPPMLLLLLFGERLFAFVFGSGWVDAAQLAITLAAPGAVKLGTMPVGALIPALRIHRSSTLLELIFFPRIFLVLAASALGHGLSTAIIWLALATILYDVIMFVWALKAGIRHDRALASGSG